MKIEIAPVIAPVEIHFLGWQVQNLFYLIRFCTGSTNMMSHMEIYFKGDTSNWCHRCKIYEILLDFAPVAPIWCVTFEKYFHMTHHIA